MKGLNLSGFKKVVDDNSKAVLQHPEGHTIHIAKAAISKPLLDQLAKLPLHQASPQEPVPEPAPAPDDTPIPPGQDQPPDAPGQILPAVPSLGPDVPGGPLNVAQEAYSTPRLEQAEAADRAPQAENTQAPAPEKAVKAGDEFAGQPGYSEQMAGKSAETKALGEEADTRQGFLAKNEVDEQEALKSLHGTLQHDRDQMGLVIKEMQDNTINPKHYLQSMSTGSKIAAAIGLLAGGMASARTGVNPAMQFLQSQIERDLEAQKANMAQRHNLLTAFQNQFKDDLTAESAFRAARAGLLANQLEQASLSAVSPLAKAQMLQFAGQLKQQYYPQVLQRRMMQALGSDQAGSISPATKVELMERSGLIDPAKAKAAREELGKSEQLEQVRASLRDSFNDLNKRILAGHLSPSDRQSAIQLNSGLLAKAAEGRFNLQEAQNQINAILPGIESAETRNLKSQRLDQFINQLKETPTLDGLGIRVNPAPAIQHPVKGKDGKPYIRQGNMMVPYKGQ